MSTTVGLGQTHTLGCVWEPGSELESNTSTKRHKSTEARKRAAEDLELIPTTTQDAATSTVAAPCEDRKLLVGRQPSLTRGWTTRQVSELPGMAPGRHVAEGGGGGNGRVRGTGGGASV